MTTDQNVISSELKPSVTKSERDSPLDPDSRQALAVELIVVLGFFWLPYMLAAIDRYWNPLRTDLLSFQVWQTAVGSGWAELARTAFQPVVVLWIVALHKGGLSTITSKPRWSDLMIGPILFVVQIAAYSVTAVVLMRAFGGRASNLYSSTLASMLSALPFPLLLARSTFTSLGEELAMRAFLQTRLTQLGWSSWAIVFTSAVLQSAYHLYQGVQAAALMLPMFVIAALVYQRQRRLWPLWFAHWLADVYSLAVWYVWARF